MSKTIIEVFKNQNESSVNLIRRFQKRTQESGVLNRARASRYNERPKSKLSRKTSALLVLKRRGEIERLKKLGKMPEQPQGRKRR